jgi:hypothetical protein
MSDYRPTSTPDPSILAERERRDLRHRTGIGVLIAIAMLASLVTFIALAPERIESVFLAAGILAGVGLISWMRHCGSGHEHHRLRLQNQALAETLAKVLAAVDDLRAEQKAAITNASNRFESALRDLTAGLDANERERRLAEASRAVKNINRQLGGEHDQDETPAMGSTTLHSLAANTPARGVRRLRNQRADDFEGA